MTFPPEVRVHQLVSHFGIDGAEEVCRRLDERELQRLESKMNNLRRQFWTLIAKGLAAMVAALGVMGLVIYSIVRSL